MEAIGSNGTEWQRAGCKALSPRISTYRPNSEPVRIPCAPSLPALSAASDNFARATHFSQNPVCTLEKEESKREGEPENTSMLGNHVAHTPAAERPVSCFKNNHIQKHTVMFSTTGRFKLGSQYVAQSCIMTRRLARSLPRRYAASVLSATRWASAASAISPW